MSRLSRVTPGVVLGVIAVVLALGGSAFAAKSYLITSKDQISPSVRKALKGNIGKTGKTGKTGPAGTVGPAGAEGKEGPRGPEGPRGEQGLQGLQGQPGAVSTQTSHFDGPNAIPANTGNFQTVVGQVPGPGSYLAIAKLSITPTGAGEVNCSLVGFQSSIAGYDVSSIKGDGIEQTITLTYPGTFTAPLAPSFAGFVLFCSTPAGTSASYQQAKISLIQTNTASYVNG